MRPRPEPLTPTGIISRQASELRASYTAQEAARTPAGDPFRWFWRTLVEVIHKADRDRMLGLAAETAFFAVLTLFPALLVVAAVLGQLGLIIGAGNARRVEDGVLEFLNDLLTDSASPAVDTVRGLFDSNTGALTFATVLALFSLSTAFATIVNTVNIAYDVPETRGWWQRRFLGLLLGAGTVLTGALAVTLLVIGPLFGRAEDVVANIGLDTAYASLWSLLRWPVAFLALVVWATTMDHFAPARRIRWREDLPGGLLTAIVWVAASYGLNVYVSTVVTSSPVFGALGGGLILMSWFYLLCVALLSGAELNAILLARRRHRRAQRAAQAVRLPDGSTGPATSSRRSPAQQEAAERRRREAARPQDEAEQPQAGPVGAERPAPGRQPVGEEPDQAGPAACAGDSDDQAAVAGPRTSPS